MENGPTLGEAYNMRRTPAQAEREKLPGVSAWLAFQEERRKSRAAHEHQVAVMARQIELGLPMGGQRG